MASSSTSSVQKSFKYDVFLSFRGEDTRNTFVGHLYNALQHKSIHTYKDDERIKKGERIGDELIKSIEDSKFYIIVFSRNYASSSWCLDELVKIMECQKTTEHTAYPVFYDVEPTEVRKQSGEFGNAFAKQEKKEAAGKWREAMEEAAGLAGWELKKSVDGDEAKFIQKIVEEISLELRCINFDVDEKLVGMETRIKGVVSSLEMGFDDVRMIGIKGMGGAGKTTLARAVFDHISFEFEGSSFVENVRENSNPNLSGLKKLQEQVLKDVSNDMDINISSVHDGKKMMKKRMCCIKVLVVLDDVDNIHQLEALAGQCNWFKTGSRIIITTRDEQPLVAHRINSILYASFLSDMEALCLFSRYAFGKEIPIQGYEELSKQVVLYAAGLPLALTVLGSFLCGKNELEWKDAIQRLKTIPSKDTFDILEISYNGLEEEHKEIFLDVACILKGLHKDDATKALESCGFYATIGLRVLEQKSLITISEHGFLHMHDRIEEMGQYIVRHKHEEPRNHSRLWIDEEIKDVLASDKGPNEAIRCIKLDTSQVDPEIVMKGFGNMKKLRFLQVENRYGYLSNNWKFDEDLPSFPNALRSLRWALYPYGSLPKSFQANNLVELKMFNSKIVQLWEGGDTKVLNKLRFLDLRYSNLKSLDLSLTPNLETLDLEQCNDLVELHMPAECPKLISLKVGRSKLTTLDLRAGTPNFEKLYLDKCVDLVELHIPGEGLKLRSVEIKSSKLTTLDLRGTPNLEKLTLDECFDLVELHIPAECLKLKSIEISCSNLKTLDLRGTPNLEKLTLDKCVDLVELHIPGERLKLEYIKIDGSKLTTLDLRGTPNLEELNLYECVDLVELHFPGERLKLESIFISCCSKLTTLDLRGTPNLERLTLDKCVDLVELHFPGERLKLESIFISCYSKLTTLDLRGTPNLERLTLDKCVDLVELHIPDERLKLKSIEINGSKLKTLDLRGTPNLERLTLDECVDLVELHFPAECLKLKSIVIKVSKLTLDLRRTPNLETLTLYECDDLVELHIPDKLKSVEIKDLKLRTLDLRGTPNLARLILDKCVDLVELHIPGERLKLDTIFIGCCSKLTTLDLRGTPNLERLTLDKCVDLVELHFPGERLKLESIEINGSKLTTLDLRGTSNLEKLHLDDCDDLVELHIPGECLKLESIVINVSKLTLDLRRTPNLEKLTLYECDDLVELHIPDKLKSVEIKDLKLRTLDLRGTPNLEELTLDECVDLVELHFPGERLKLESIFIGCCSKLTTLDLRGTPNLERLTLDKCVDLVELHIPDERLKLKSIKINGSKLKTLDLRGTPNLEELTLDECVDLVELHFPGERLKLESIFISCCSKLTTLDLRGTPNLEMLTLDKCVDLVELHLPDERLKLESIEINGSKFTTLDLRGTPNLEELTLDECVDLVELHFPGERLKLESIFISCCSKLTTLDLRGTPNLERLTLDKCVDLVELHIPDERLKLESIEINGSKFTTLDLRGTPNLEKLTLYGCVDLVELHIPGEHLKLESIKINKSKLRTLDLRGTPNLKTLFLTKCYHLVEVHTHDGCLKKLHQLDLSDCLRFKAFSFNKLLSSSSSSVEVGCISKLHLKAESLEMCPLHIGNNLPNFRFECFYEEHPFKLIGNVEKLISFGLCACTTLERFSQSICGLQGLTRLILEGGIPEAPKDLDRLECLEELNLLSTKITLLPDSICKLKHLKCLKLDRCWLLEKLPEDLGRLECLKILILSKCVFLRHIPDSICMMKRLQCFLLPGCISVEKLPEEIGRLRCLRELDIDGTKIRNLPESIFELKGLRIVAFRWLLQSYGFTSQIQTLDKGKTYIVTGS